MLNTMQQFKKEAKLYHYRTSELKKKFRNYNILLSALDYTLNNKVDLVSCVQELLKHPEWSQIFNVMLAKGYVRAIKEMFHLLYS